MKAGIKTKILIIMLAVAFIPGIVGVLSTYIKGSQVFRSAVGTKFEEMTRQVSLSIDMMIEKEISEASIMAASPVIKEFIYSGGLQDSAIKKKAENQLYRYLSLEVKQKGHAYVSIHDSSGNIISRVGQPKVGQPIEPEILALLKKGESPTVLLGRPFKSKTHEALMLPIYAPVYDPDGKKLKGALATYLDIEKSFARIGDITFGDSGHINLVTSEGDTLYDPLTPGGGEPFSKKIMGKVKEAKEPWFIDVDEHDLEAVISFHPINYSFIGNDTNADSYKWFIILTQPTDEAFGKPLNEVLFGAAVPGFIFATMLIAIIYVALKRIVDPIEVLKKGVSAIGKGDLDSRIEIKTGDEIEDLANEFNRMASELKDLYDDLEEKVRERTLELEASNRELEKANRLKSEFLANMSHELRTPLNSIIGFSEVLSDKIYGETNEKQDKYLNNINKSGKHLLEIINEILDLSKIEAGKMDFLLSEFLLADAVEEVLNIISPLAANKDVNLSPSLQEGIGVISADMLKLKQILYNLLGNAIKFTPSGGSVSLNAARKDDSIEISITDTGVGIEDEALDVIFKPFRQADGSHARTFEGTGLGLTLTKKFVEMHGGEIRVESRAGEGSTFTFTLPQKGRDRQGQG